MATLTNGMVMIALAQIGLYFTLYKHKVRLWRMIGCVAIVLVGLSTVMVEDTVPAFVFAGISIIIAGIPFFKDVASLVKG